MLEIKTNLESKVQTFNLPTKLSEIGYDYMKGVTNHVHLANNWALVAVVCKTELGMLLDAKRKDTSVSATYVLVDKNDKDNTCPAKLGSLVICEGTSVMRGIEVAAPKNILAPSKIIGYINAHNKQIGNKKIAINSEEYFKNIYFVTFKLVPLSDIHGYYDEDNKDASDAVISKFITEVSA